MIRHLIAALALTVFACAAPAPALAAGSGTPVLPISATCTTFAAALTAVAPGGTIVLTSATPCPSIAVTGKSYKPGIVVDATAATLTSVALNGVVGLSWHGGNFDGANKTSTAWSAGTSSFVGVEGATMRNYLRNNIIIGSSSDFRVVGNWMSRSGADGIDIALSRRGVIDGNLCSDPDTTTGSHPDCIQLWSRPEQPPVSFITITRNMAFGLMQGINGFNHVRGGINDGGFDNITVADNLIAVAMPDGIYFTDCRNCSFKGNHFYTPHGAAHWTNFTINGVSTGSLLASDQSFQDNR
ncbi:MAG: hypothetical protein ACRYG4_04025 [Janthinobacterium lividum]